MANHFEIPLPNPDLGKSLASMVLRPDLVACMWLFRTDVTSTFLAIDTIMFSLAMFLH
jgi:hypothetical protein